MRYLLCIFFIGLQPLWAQTNESKADSLPPLGVEKKKRVTGHKPEIWGGVFLRGQIANRNFKWLQNDLYVAFNGEDWESAPHKVSAPFERNGIRFDANLFGIYDNDGPGFTTSKFRANTYVFYSMRVSYTFMPKTEMADAGHQFEIGFDGGARYFFTKWLHAEVGLQTNPLAMGYSGLSRTQFPEITMPNGMQVDGVDISLFQMYVGIIPYARVGVYASKRISLDVSYGTNINWVYFQNNAAFPTYQGFFLDTDAVDIKPRNVLMDGRQLKNRDISLNGRQIGFSLTYHIP
jgi:hypothetical protein